MSRLRVGMLCWLYIPGVVLLALGVYRDYTGWSDHFQFTSWIMSGITSGCFGIPVAANIVQGLVRREAVRRRRQEILTTARRTVSGMQEAIERPGVPQVLELLESTKRAKARLHLYRTTDATDRDGGALVADAASSLTGLLDAISTHRASVESGPEQYSSLLSRWRFFGDTVMQQAEAADILLIPDWLYYELSGNLEKLGAGQPLPYLEILRSVEFGSRFFADMKPAWHAANRDAAELDVIAESLQSLETSLTVRNNLYKNILIIRQTVQGISVDRNEVRG